MRPSTTRPGTSIDDSVLSVSVVVCAYSEDRWRQLRDAIRSIEAQARPARQVILVVDHNPSLQERAAAAFPSVDVIPSEGRPGLSEARNTGTRAAIGDLVAFLDDDARADPTWLENLTAAFAAPEVLGAGGVVRPRWEQDAPPRWLPPEFYWTVGCSYRGLPSRAEPIRNPIGANMSFRRELYSDIGGFIQGFGRVGTTPLGCEETEFFIRARARHPSGLVMYVPDAGVDHAVPSERTTWRYFRSRCWSEGISKAMVASEVGQDRALSTERAYAARVLSAGVVGGVRDLVAKGDVGGLLRAGSIVAGLAITTCGYVFGRLGGRAT